MAAIPQTTFSDKFQEKKMFHWSYPQGSNWKYTSVGLDNAWRLKRRKPLSEPKDA